MNQPAFPAELSGRAQWLVWRLVDKPGQKKPAKMPYYADGGIRQGVQGSPEDRARLVTLEQAWDAVGRLGADGLGFAFLPGDGLIGIDLDAVDRTEREPLTERILTACCTYAEWSPSERGIHIIGRGTAKTIKSNEIGVELFCGRQFFTMTGNALQHASIRPDVQPIADGAIQLITDAVLAARTRPAPAPPPMPATAASAAPQARVGGSVDRYVTRAFDAAVERVKIAAEGGRNDTLNQEAYGLGRLLHTGLLSEHRIVAELTQAAAACGLPAGEAAATIRSGLTAGAQQPRVIEERFDRRSVDPSAAAPASVDPTTGEILPPPAANDNAPVDFGAVDWLRPFPDTDNKGKPLATIANVLEACRRLRVTIRYNVIAKEVELIIPGAGFSIDNQANASLAWLISALEKFRVPTGKVDEYVTYLADQNPYNPVANWITSQPWDGQSRFDALLHTICCEAEEDDPAVARRKRSILLRWMISAVAAAFRPNGVSAHGVLVMQGEQYLGKTAWFKSLVPASLGVIQDGMLLKADDKDSVKQAVSFWLVELGELDATFKRSDIAQLKAWLTRDKDVLRAAYARRESKYARRTVFFASVNPRQYLHDPTGNRRYWTLSCVGLNHQHGLNMQQVWAEIYQAHYQQGESWYLTPEEMADLNEANKAHEVLDPVQERLTSHYRWDEPESLWRWMTATEVMLEMGFDRPSRADVTNCGQLVGDLNSGQRRRSNGRNLLRMPPKPLPGA